MYHANGKAEVLQTNSLDKGDNCKINQLQLLYKITVEASGNSISFIWQPDPITYVVNKTFKQSQIRSSTVIKDDPTV